MGAEGLNRWQGYGGLGADAELKSLPKGGHILKFRMACTAKYKGNDGVWQERTEWVRCVLFGKRAEGLAPYLSKGNKIYVEGSLRTSSWEKEGQKHYSTEVMVDRVILTSPKRESSAKRSGGGWDDDPPAGKKAGGPEDSYYDEEPAGLPPAEAAKEPEDDIPF
jgi:single-strand DNA-binding protein